MSVKCRNGSRPSLDNKSSSLAGIDYDLFSRLSQLRRLGWMRGFRMVVMQVRSQMVSNYDVLGHGCFEKIFLHLAR